MYEFATGWESSKGRNYNQSNKTLGHQMAISRKGQNYDPSPQNYDPSSMNDDHMLLPQLGNIQLQAMYHPHNNDQQQT